MWRGLNSAVRDQGLWKVKLPNDFLADPTITSSFVRKTAIHTKQIETVFVTMLLVSRVEWNLIALSAGVGSR